MTPIEAIRKIKEHNEIHQHKEPYAFYITEALNMAVDALEKQIPKKPIIRLTGQMCGNWIRSCPTCNAKLVERVTTVDISVPHIYNNSNFCIKCGQRLDWGDEK